jgi:hypothetical protein
MDRPINQYMQDLIVDTENAARYLDTKIYITLPHNKISQMKNSNTTHILHKTQLHIQWKPLIMVTLGPTLFDINNWLITLSGGYKNLHYLTQFIVTNFYMYKKQQNLF